MPLSPLLLQGVEQIKNEVEDPGTALIDGIHGHGRYYYTLKIKTQTKINVTEKFLSFGICYHVIPLQICSFLGITHKSDMISKCIFQITKKKYSSQHHALGHI